jgi:macrodomain Ter protein organizer (MatP/YcbG family)
MSMPRKGYRSISLKDQVFEQLQKKADEEHRTIPETIEHLLEVYEEA